MAEREGFVLPDRTPFKFCRFCYLKARKTRLFRTMAWVERFVIVHLGSPQTATQTGLLTGLLGAEKPIWLGVADGPFPS